MKFWGATAFMLSHELVDLARALDEAGYHGAMVSDHIIHPRELSSDYPYTDDGEPIWTPETSWPDTWVLIGAMAGATTNLHFSNNVFVAPNRPLLAVAKAVGTAAAISGNRIELGVAAGWMREEFDLMGQDYTTRGRRLNEMIPALRELWKPGWVEWHGEFYDLPAMMLGPSPTEPIPIYCGGDSMPALRRAAKYCDGWVGNPYTWDQAEAKIATLRRLLAEEGRADDPFEIIIALYHEPDVDLYRRAEEELGVTGLVCQPWAGEAGILNRGDDAALIRPAAAYLDSINRFAEEFVHPLM